MEISYFYSVTLILSKQSTYDQEFLGRIYSTYILSAVCLKWRG